MAIPPFLLLDDSYTDVQDLTQLVKRIGIANSVRVFGRLSDAQGFLLDADAARRPVVVLAAGPVRGGHGIELLRWIRTQPRLADLSLLALLAAEEDSARRDAVELGVGIVDKPLEMRPLIAAMKALGLAEKVRINSMTMSVEVELWPPA